jgi:hypothetical protein
MVDIRIRVGEQPTPLIRIGCKILEHVFVDFLLQIDTDGAVCADDLVSADTRVGGNVSAGVPNSDVSRNVADGVMRTFIRGCDQPAREFLTGSQRGVRLRDGGGKRYRVQNHQRQPMSACRPGLHLARL